MEHRDSDYPRDFRGDDAPEPYDPIRLSFGPNHHDLDSIDVTAIDVDPSEGFIDISHDGYVDDSNTPLTVAEYGRRAADTFVDGRENSTDTDRLVMGLVGEAGEVAEKRKKMLRGDDVTVDDVADELGDVLWYLSVLADELGTSLDDVATDNLDKLDDRSDRDVIRGSGDER